MTQKELRKIAASDELMWLLQEMVEIDRNMVHKTVYERKTAERKMRDLAREIIDSVNEGR